MQIANFKLQVDDGQRSRPLEVACGWLLGVQGTIYLAAAISFANCGLFGGDSIGATQLLPWLEYNREAILQGQLWRLVTGNLVHWSVEHFYLDLGAFLALGLLYEPSFKRSTVSLAAFLGAVSLAIGLTLLAFLPELNIYRGLSGVDSGLFAAALIVEAMHAKSDPRRWIWLAPAALIFTIKILFECLTGELFFGTSSLGDLGQPVPLAHAAGAVASVPLAFLRREQANRRL
jgi:rhomboid family GlyGly-CTERM serine protease